MTDPAFLSRFTPSRTSPEILEKIFVQREDRARDTEDRIVDSVTNGGKHQLLFVGPRGSGKSHFVTLLYHRLQAREDLRDRLRIAWLAEDETTTSFFKLLLRIYHALQERYPGEFPVPDTSMLQSMEIEARIRWLTRTLVEKLSGRTLLVILENLDERFKDLGDEGQKRWRAFLQENIVTTTLATSQQLFAGVSRRVSPFFGFFQVEHLKPLEFDDAILLMTKIAEEVKRDQELTAFLRSPTGRSRVRALYHLSGGNHRIYIILSEFITRESLDELIGPFEKMLDELTPYYQARLDSLSPQQREIVEFLARAKYAVPVKEIASQLFFTHQTVTPQLKELKEKGYVSSHQVGRESRYELTEPLMRLCVEVKDNHRQPVRLLVDFLRLWYSREQLAERLEKLPSHALVERQYVEQSIRTIDTGTKNPIVRYLVNDLKLQRLTGIPENLIPILEELAATRSNFEDWIELGVVLSRLGRAEEALQCFERSIQLDPDDPTAWKGKGLALGRLGREEEALRCFEKATELKPADAKAIFYKGFALDRLGCVEDALKCFEGAIDLDPDDFDAWFYKGRTLGILGRVEESFRYFERATDLNAGKAVAWMARCTTLMGLGCLEEALACLEKAKELKPRDTFLLLYIEGLLLQTLGQHEEALPYLESVAAICTDDALRSLFRGDALLSLDRAEEAFRCFETAVELVPNDASAWDGLATCLFSLNRFEEAEIALERARALKPDDPVANDSRAEALLGNEGLEIAFVLLNGALRRLEATGTDTDLPQIELIIQIVLLYTKDQAFWKERLDRLVRIVAEAGVLNYLGRELVRSLEFLPTLGFDAGSLRAWCDVWNDVGQMHEVLRLPLRLYDVGIRYLETGERKVLRDLVSEERRIVEEALGLEPADDARDSG